MIFTSASTTVYLQNESIKCRRNKLLKTFKCVTIENKLGCSMRVNIGITSKRYNPLNDVIITQTNLSFVKKNNICCDIEASQ